MSFDYAAARLRSDDNLGRKCFGSKYLTNPLVGLAVRDDADGSIVIPSLEGADT